MNKKYVSAISRAMFDTNLVATRFSLAIAEFLWAILLFWPGHTFDRPTYMIMSHVMPEHVWAFVFLLTGCLQLLIVMRECFHTLFSRLFATWNALLWGFVVMSMLLSVYPPPAAISGEIALALGAIWIWVRPFILFNGIVYARRKTKYQHG